MEHDILKILAFFSAVGRALKVEEIYRLLPAKPNPHELIAKLKELKSSGSVLEEHGFFAIAGTEEGFSLRRKKQDEILEEKWARFLKIRWVFTIVPYLDFVLMAGSMAVGNVRENSDFDVIIGAKPGKIFTVRWFAVLLLSLFGLRRKKTDGKADSKNKVCLNHFVTPKSYALEPPYNFYWQTLYKSLVPVLGYEEPTLKFFEANGWAGESEKLKSYFAPMVPSPFRNALEFFLWGPFGNLFEKIVKAIQVSRIKKGIEKEERGYGPRVRYTDDELEFHPDTSRIDAVLDKSSKIFPETIRPKE